MFRIEDLSIRLSGELDDPAKTGPLTETDSEHCGLSAQPCSCGGGGGGGDDGEGEQAREALRRQLRSGLGGALQLSPSARH